VFVTSCRRSIVSAAIARNRSHMRRSVESPALAQRARPVVHVEGGDAEARCARARARRTHLHERFFECGRSPSASPTDVHCVVSVRSDRDFSEVPERNLDDTTVVDRRLKEAGSGE